MVDLSIVFNVCLPGRVTIGWSVGWLSQWIPVTSSGALSVSPPFRPDWKHKRWDHIWVEISEVFLSWKACWLRDDSDKSWCGEFETDRSWPCRTERSLRKIIGHGGFERETWSPWDIMLSDSILLNSFPCHLRACRPSGQLPWESRAFPGPISIELWHIVSVFGTYLWPCFGGFKLLFTWVECQDLMEHMFLIFA